MAQKLSCRPSDMRDMGAIWIMSPSAKRDEEEEDEEEDEMEDDEEDTDSDGGPSDGEGGEENTCSTKEEMKQTSRLKTGKWMLFLNKYNRDKKGDTELDRVWKQVKVLVQQGRLWKASCSTAKSDPRSTKKQDRGVISCFTQDYTDKDGVKDAAVRIRQIVSFPRPMFYKTSKAAKDRKYRVTGAKNMSLYRHDPDGTLYISNDSKWKRVTKKTVVKQENDGSSPSDIRDMKWVHNLKSRKETSIKRAWVLRIEMQSSESEEGNNLCAIWDNVEELVRLGKLKNAAIDKGDIQDFQFIYCCVEDSREEKEAASDLRSVVYIQQPIFYKEEVNRLQGPDAWKKFIRTADKLYTQDGRLMGQRPVWTQLVPSKVKPPADQPSIVQSSMIITAKPYILPLEDKPGRWTLFLDRLVVDKEGNTELDRAWVVIKGLVQKGVLVDAVTTTAATNPFNLQHNQGAIFCYTRDYSDLNEVKITADSIRKAVHPSTDMLFEPVTTVLVTDLQNWDFDQVSTYKQTVNAKFAKLYSKFNREWVFAPHKCARRRMTTS